MYQFYAEGGEQTGETVGDWFEFMWSVTRAVRKDITQQNSHDLVSVACVEKCARLHVFCAERLCEEDVFNFSPKLNDENLTKCLTSLKHMYYDLKLEGVVAPNETEFRCYDVLMNLNDGETLQKVQSLAEEIRTDERLKFALECYTAIESNNYVRFFKLVKKASFLNACILKRYFHQVRRKGLATIIVGFVPGKTMVHFPIEKIVNWLGFESAEECGGFLRAHGVEWEEDTAYLERGAVQMFPDTPPPVTRSRSLIEGKKTVSYGEIMNGGPLGENPYFDYHPHDSFDEKGYLKVESYNAKDQDVTVSPTFVENLLSKFNPRQRTDTHQNVLLATEIMGSLTSKHCEVTAEAIGEEVLREEMEAIFLADIEETCLKELTASVAADTLREARNQLLAQKLLEDQKAEEEAEAINEVILDLVDNITVEVGEEMMEGVKNERKLQKYLEVAKVVSDEMIENMLGRTVEEIVKTALLEVETELEENIRKFKENVKTRQMRRVFQEWRRLAAKSARQREAVENFPVCPASLSCGEQVERLGGAGDHTGLAATLARRHQLDLLLRSRQLETCAAEAAILQPLLLQDWVSEAATSCKLLLSFPSLQADSDWQPLQEMVRYKLRVNLPGEKAPGPGLLACGTVAGRHGRLGLCVREVTGTDSQQEVAGTTALLFLCLQEEGETAARARLSTLFHTLPAQPAIPLAVLSDRGSDQTAAMLGLANLQSTGRLSSYQFHAVSPDIFQLEQQVGLVKAVRELLQSPGPAPPPLVIKPLQHLLEDFLTTEVFSRFYSDLATRRVADLPDRPPEQLLALYNAGVEACMAAVSDSELQHLAGPAREWGVGLRLPQDWNTVGVAAELADQAGGARLPGEVGALCEDSWRGSVAGVLAWLDRATIKGPSQDCSQAATTVKAALAGCYRQFSSLCGGGEVVVPPAALLPWTEIVVAAGRHQLACLPTTTVGYREAALADWEPPGEWKAGLGWGGQRDTETVQSMVDTTVSEARDQTELGVPTTNLQLRQQLRREQRESCR